MPVNPGRLRERVQIQAVKRVIVAGGYADTWEDSEQVWANIAQPTPSGAARYAQAGYSLVTHEVTLRAGPVVQLGKTRFTLGTRVFQVLAPPRDSDQTGRFITVACRELNPSEAQPSGEEGSSA